jgi:hypothetical protein
LDQLIAQWEDAINLLRARQQALEAAEMLLRSKLPGL